NNHHSAQLPGQTQSGNTFVAFLSKRSEMRKYIELPAKGEKSREDVNGVDLLKSALTNAFYDLDEVPTGFCRHALQVV
ncbi:MAG: hypothetical protein AAF485_10525, partial [Chloroflexota bacterium]